MLYIVIERYKNRDAKPVYDRFRENGRMLPSGIAYVGSWVETNFDRCFQLMETDNSSLFDQWVEHWKDLIDFEIIPVMTSVEAYADHDKKTS